MTAAWWRGDAFVVMRGGMPSQFASRNGRRHGMDVQRRRNAKKHFPKLLSRLSSA